MSDQKPSQPDISTALAGASFQGMQGVNPTSGHAVEHPSSGILDWLLDGAAARKHREVLSHNRHTTIETMEAITDATMISTDMVANCFDAEHTMQQLIMQYGDSEMVLKSAPFYVQQARAMLMNSVPSIAQTGITRIKNKIEKR